MSCDDSNITDLTRERLRRSPFVYSVEICHDEDGMSFMVHDIQDSKRDRLAVARDLEQAAQVLKRDPAPG